MWGEEEKWHDGVGGAKCQGSILILWDGLEDHAVGVFPLPCSGLTTTSSVYPAGPIRDNLSSEEPNCLHYYSMKPFTAHFMNCNYWRVKNIGFLCRVAALFTQLCNDNRTELQSIVQIFTVANEYGHRFTSCRSADSCHRGSLWLLSRLHYGNIWRLHVWEMKSSAVVVCVSPSCFLIDYFLWIYWP